MIQLITQIAVAVGALAGLATWVYKVYLSPKAKAKRKARDEGKKAIDNGDISGVTGSFDRLRRK